MKEKSSNKILILPSWYPPDGGSFFSDHAEAINGDGFIVHVLVNRTVSLTSNSIKEIVHSGRRTKQMEKGVFVLRSSTFKWPKFEEWNLKRWIKSYIELFEYYKAEHGIPDIIIAQSSMWAGTVAAELKDKYNIPYILIEHRSRFTDHLDLFSGYFKIWYDSYLKNAFSKADKLVCVSNSLKSKISRISNVPVAKMLTIANLLKTDFFCPSERSRELQPFVFLSAGSLQPAKGMDILLGAFSGFLDQNEGEFFLRIAGKGRDEKLLKKYAEDLGIMDRVSFLGKVSRERIRDEMQRSNVFILPSRFEAFGVVLIEAISTACPVIATLSGGPESIVNEQNGFLVKVEDEEGLTQAMSRMYLRYQNFNPEVIRNEAVEKYSSGYIAEKYRTLIRETINEYNIIGS